jgi:hypothetical protein
MALKDDYHFFKENRERFVAEHLGKFIVLKDEVLIGVYDDPLDAVVKSAAQGHEVGTFLVQLVTETPIVHRFRSRRRA